tara:strand:+ start:10272 stop:10607 length:336 start_codon:yes stop_codon:yes gene_type:complete
MTQNDFRLHEAIGLLDKTGTKLTTLVKTLQAARHQIPPTQLKEFDNNLRLLRAVLEAESLLVESVLIALTERVPKSEYNELAKWKALAIKYINATGGDATSIGYLKVSDFL